MARRLKCPKCGNPTTTMEYTRGFKTKEDMGVSITFGMANADCLQHPLGEHFHRSCGRCNYYWATSDVDTEGEN